MKLRLVLMAALIFALPARADWVVGTTTTAAKSDRQRTYTYEFTTAADSTPVDLSACASTSYTFDQSVLDSSTDAVIDVRACHTSSDAWQACKTIYLGPSQLPDGVEVGAGTPPADRPYVLVHVVTTPSSDTARVNIKCNSTVSVGQVSNGPRAGATPGISNEPCSSTGVCPDPYGMLFIDMFPATAANPGGVYDLNGSMWGDPNDAGICAGSSWSAGCADAFDDYIRTTDIATSFTFAASIGQFAYSVASALPASTSTGTLDGQFCRRDETFAVCTTTSGTDDCVPTFAASLQSAINIVARKTVTNTNCTANGVPSAACTGSGTGYRYYPSVLSTYSGCNSSSASQYSAWHTFGAAMTTSDSFQRMWPDGTHISPYGAGLMAQMIAEAKWESVYRGPGNLVTNGDMETDCATSGWHVWNATDYTTTTNMSTATWTAQRINPLSGVSGGANGGAYGSSCVLSNSRAAGTGLVSDLITVDPYKWYQFAFYASSGNITTGHGIAIDVIDSAAAGSAASITAATGASSDLKVWEYDGGEWLALSGSPPVTAVTTGSAIQCYGTCYFVGKFYSRGNTSVRLKVYTQGATEHTTFKMDDVRVYPAQFQNPSLNNVFPDSVQTWTMQGDSGSQESQTNFPSQMDAIFGAWRPGITLNGTFSNNSLAGNTTSPLLSTAYLAANEGATWTTNRLPTYGIIQLGTNDLLAGNTPTAASVRAQWLALKNRFKQNGIVPVLIGPWPYRGNTTQTSCSGGLNCAKKAYDAMQIMFTNGDTN